MAAASRLSSTIRIRRGTLAAGSAGAAGCGGAGDCQHDRQSHDELAPVPEARAAGLEVPPCISVKVFASVRPMPSPLDDRSSDVSTCANISNTRESWSAAMPMPVSRTRMTTLFRCLQGPSPRSTVSQMCPPRSVNLHALFKRLPTICARRAGSASTNTGPDGSVTVSSWPLRSASERTASTASVDDRGQFDGLLGEGRSCRG